jgi:hypothetical protein
MGKHCTCVKVSKCCSRGRVCKVTRIHFKGWNLLGNLFYSAPPCAAGLGHRHAFPRLAPGPHPRPLPSPLKGCAAGVRVLDSRAPLAWDVHRPYFDTQGFRVLGFRVKNPYRRITLPSLLIIILGRRGSENHYVGPNASGVRVLDLCAPLAQDVDRATPRYPGF